MVVHLPSASLSAWQRESLPLAHVREHAQMARMCDLADPLVEVVYVAPFSLTTVGVWSCIASLSLTWLTTRWRLHLHL